MKIVFIGAGSLTEAMLEGLQSFGFDGEIWVTNRSSSERLHMLNQKFSIQTSYNKKVLLQGATVVFLAVKPKDAVESIQSLLPHLEKETILISLMAGISISLIETMVGANMSIGRAMPNTSAASNQSATAISYNRDTTDHQKSTVKEILSTIGIVEETNEDSLDLFTAVSGSGPAYFYYLVEALEEAATQYGMSETTAKQFIIQTLVGAGATMKKDRQASCTVKKRSHKPRRDNSWNKSLNKSRSEGSSSRVHHASVSAEYEITCRDRRKSITAIKTVIEQHSFYSIPLLAILLLNRKGIIEYGEII
nr:pyrroline-5-carboxylate reductase [Bacillus coahuilensis]